MNTVIEFGGRRSGRTTRLLEWLTQGEGRVLLVHSNVERTRLTHIIGTDEKYHAVQDWQIQEYSQAPYNLPGRAVTEIAVDNLDLFLPRLSAPITLITATLAENFGTHHQRGFEVKFPIQFRH